jgi:hypothetical protein
MTEKRNFIHLSRKHNVLSEILQEKKKPVLIVCSILWKQAIFNLLVSFSNFAILIINSSTDIIKIKCKMKTRNINIATLSVEEGHIDT